MLSKHSFLVHQGGEKMQHIEHNFETLEGEEMELDEDATYVVVETLVFAFQNSLTFTHRVKVWMEGS